jgi:2-methylfumaryl-CoA hydratase
MSSKTDAGNFFEDFNLNHVFHCPIPRTLTVGDASQYIAMTGERTPRFCDARNEIHPLLVFHTVLGQTVRQVSLNARANLGYAGLHWLLPVKAGDTLRTEAEVLGLKENSNRETGIVYVKTRAFNQNDKPVMEYVRWVMVKKRDLKAQTAFLDKPVVPELPAALTADQLTLAKEALPTKQATGGRFIFSDYQAGERIAHIDGMTVNWSDHMSFTRLFQNGAKIHFDTLLTDGKPLVFGGYPMSLGYAQSFNGLENRTGICAINAGSHANPVYAGDTLYSFTEVLETHKVAGNLGALRLRLVVVKNERLDEASVKTFAIKVDCAKKPGNQVYHDKVVLDLDYWDHIATNA